MFRLSKQHSLELLTFLPTRLFKVLCSTLSDETVYCTANELLCLLKRTAEFSMWNYPNCIVNCKFESCINAVAEEQIQHSDREVYFEAFIKWLHENGIATDSVKIAKFDQGYGLQATKDIKVTHYRFIEDKCCIVPYL